jgi:hypothetical protein
MSLSLPGLPSWLDAIFPKTIYLVKFVIVDTVIDRPMPDLQGEGSLSLPTHSRRELGRTP